MHLDTRGAIVFWRRVPVTLENPMSVLVQRPGRYSRLRSEISKEASHARQCSNQQTERYLG